MFHPRNFLAVAAGLLSVALIGNQASAQCSSGGGMSPGSPTTFASSLNYSQNPLASNGYSSGNLMAMQYQQQVLGTQRQIASLLYQNAERQRRASHEREVQARPYRLARAEAKRAARAERIAARLRDQGQYSDSYRLAAINID